MKPDSYRQEIDAWHAERIRRLTAPDGWLSLVALEWLQPGANRLGSAADNDIVLGKAPAHLGTLTLAADGSVHAAFDEADGVTVDGAPASDTVLRDDRDGEPARVACGTVNFTVIDRGGRKGLRVRDPAAATRTGFAAIERFAVDPAWRVVADWEPLDPPFTLAMATVIGTLESHPAPGRAVFERDGHRHELLPVIEAAGAGQLFVVFADATSGRETCGAARFMYADLPTNGKIVLDFNRAYNPPCAFTPYATCPLAPPENRLHIAVRAGEKRYGTGH